MRALALLLMLSPLSGAHGEPVRGMAVATDRLAADAGLQILRAGGTAADAAVAGLMALGVVEPQASGVGGGAMLVHFDAATRTVTVWDGRETAPAAIGGGPDAPGSTGSSTGGRTVGVPGAVRMLEALHHAHGRLPWADLVAPAIQLAEHGVPVSPHLAGAIAAARGALRRQLASSVFLAADGSAPASGSTLTNPALAQVLRAIAAGGANALLRGPIAAEIATAVRSGPGGGLLTTDDLAAYAPRQREPVCAPFAGRTVCAAGPPADGAGLLQMLGLLERAGLAAADPGSADAAALLMQAAQAAAADTARSLGDPDFAPAPLAALLAGPYLDLRARALGPSRPLDVPAWQPEPGHGLGSVAVVDAAGNAVAATATLGGPFGSGLFVHGFPLNAALAGFAADPSGEPASPNAVQPGKRPATAMAPAVVLDANRALLAVLGSAGGARTPAFEAQALAGLYAWRMDPLAAVSQPQALDGLPGAESGLVLITVADRLAGASDPRGEGGVADLAAAAP